MLINLDTLTLLLVDYDHKRYALEGSIEYLTTNKRKELQEELNKVEQSIIDCMKSTIEYHELQKIK